MDTPAVALGTRAAPSGSEPRNVARCRRVCVTRSTSPLSKKRIGLLSISSRRRCCARWTPIGTAPSEPWLRWATAGSREKSSRAPGSGSGGRVTQ